MEKLTPLSLIRVLKKIVELDKDFIQLEQHGDIASTFTIKDKFQRYGFYFSINSREFKEGIWRYNISYMPYNEDEFKPKNASVPIEAIQKNFDKWFELIKQYKKESNLFEDPIVQKYYEEFILDFTPTDEKADVEPFPRGAAMRFIGFISSIKNDLNNEDLDSSDINIAGIVDDINNTIDNTTKSTKSQNISSLALVFAKLFKFIPSLYQKYYALLFETKILDGVIQSNNTNILK